MLPKNILFIKKRGFTLVEILVSIAVFALAVLSVVRVYAVFSNNQNRTRAAQVTLNNSRYALGTMIREIRNGTIYDFSPATSGICQSMLGADYPNCLIVQREDGRLLAYTNNAHGDLLAVYLNCNQDYSFCSWSGEIYEDTSFARMLGPDVNNIRVDDLNFLIKPEASPFTGANPPNRQPQVTISMKVINTGSKSIEQVSYNFQTTISSRLYKR